MKAKKEITIELISIKAEFNKLFRDMKLIPGAPSDEFDSLSAKVISQLLKEVDSGKITRIVNSELTVRYGLHITHEISHQISSDLLEVWNHRKFL